MRVLFSMAALFYLLTANTLRAEGPLRIMTGIPPQKYIVEQIGGDKVKASVLVTPGKDPHMYEPTPRQIMDLSNARIYFEIGMPFEKAILDKIRQMGLKTKIIDSAEGIKRVPMEKHLLFSEHDDDPDETTGLDPHIWLSISNLKKLASNICAALSEADPANGKLYKSNLEKFNAKADALNEKISKALKPFKGGVIFVFHPAFGYFTEAYGLKQAAVEIEGKTPSPREIEKLIKKARKYNAKIIFVQPQFDSKSADAIAKAIGGTVVPLDPLAKNVFEGLEKIAEKIEASLKSRK